MLNKFYFPFEQEVFLRHFADVKEKGKCFKNVKHLDYYLKSINNYNKYLSENINRLGKPVDYLKKSCQVEKDEKFWISASMLNIFYSKNRTEDLTLLFNSIYGDKPPVKNINTWNECFCGKLFLFFEVNLPSPNLYKKEWLKENIKNRQLIPYILDSAYGKKIFEGPTNGDAVLLNENNGFAVLMEAKVLSDISYQTTYDVLRNQVIRNIDVMLEQNSNLCYPLNNRKPEKTLFLLVTPKIFKENPSSRLYGFKFNEYKNTSSAIERDLPHRKNYNWDDISKRLGWATWEDINSINNNYCNWLNTSNYK